LALADAGELKLVRQPENMAQLIGQAVTALRVKAKDKGLELSMIFLRICLQSTLITTV